MVKKKSVKKNLNRRRNETPGVGLEKIVARIQQMMDPNSTVTHNEILEDRVGNKRQYDVVIRGQFGGRQILGVMECKDHSRKKGPEAVEAFSKKTENLGANLRIMVSKKGFTPQALRLAKHENIGCLSLLPEDPKQVGFSIGDMWYGRIRIWSNVRLVIQFPSLPAPIATFNVNTVKWNGKPIGKWFLRELFTTYSDETREGDIEIELKFDEQCNLEIEGKEYAVIGVTCIATRIFRKKKKWVNWSGDAFYDWHTRQLTIPNKGTIIGSAVETDLSAWLNYEGEIPEPGKSPVPGFSQVILEHNQKWDDSENDQVPDLRNLVTTEGVQIRFRQQTLHI